MNLSDDSKGIWEELQARQKRRSALLWSGTSIIGYIWDIIRNLIVIGIIVSIYDVLYDPVDIIIISILILIYLSITSIGAQIAQGIVRTNLYVHSRTMEIMKGFNSELTDDLDFEDAAFNLEKAQYKFILNSIFNFIVFLIVLFNLLGAL